MREPLTIVLDVGKTLAKLTLWTADGELVARETRANMRETSSLHMALDAEGIEAWMTEILASFAQRGRIGALIPVSHGAAAAVVKNGFAFPPLDYEDALSPAESADYDAQRPHFAETGSPRLPDGLNLGAQLHRLECLRPDIMAGDAMILTWAQYWAWRLCGVAATEVTSLGCHTDLWNPVTASPSSLAQKRGWAARLPPLRRAADVLGTVGQQWVKSAGLPADMVIHCGLHDSNAALLAARGFPEIADHESTVLSTGTWFVAMRSPQDGTAVSPTSLAEARDCLVNVDAYGKLVPSARFMGGREIQILTGTAAQRIDIKRDQDLLLASVDRVVAQKSRVLPSFAPGFGPFPQANGRWIDMPANQAERRAAVCLYAALVADVSLELIGARERLLVEGRFADSETFVRALATLRPDDAVYRCAAENDVSFGALRLLNPALKSVAKLERVEPLDTDLSAYRDLWHRDIAADAMFHRMSQPACDPVLS